jgi:hypothetical protein
VLVSNRSSEEWHDVVMDALRAHHRAVDDAYLDWRLRLVLQTDAAVEIDVRHVRHVGVRWFCSDLVVGVVGFDCCVLTVKVSCIDAVVRVRSDRLAGATAV